MSKLQQRNTPQLYNSTLGHTAPNVNLCILNSTCQNVSGGTEQHLNQFILIWRFPLIIEVVVRGENRTVILEYV